MKEEISVLNSDMKVVNWLVNGWSEGGSFMKLKFCLFDLLPLTACENDKCWVSLGSYTDLVGALLIYDVPGESCWVRFKVSRSFQLLLLRWCSVVVFYGNVGGPCGQCILCSLPGGHCCKEHILQEGP